MMALDFCGISKGLSDYARQLRKRLALRKEGQGFDYTGDNWRRRVEKIVDRIHPEKMHLRLNEIIDETLSARTLRFIREDAALPPFRAGQYVNLYIEIDGVITSRAYSISSPPGLAYIDLTIRRKQNGFVSNYLLDRAGIGDRFVSSGPAGQFYYEPLLNSNELVFIAGGSGITPFMSILLDFKSRNWPVKTHLIYGSRVLDDVIFKDKLNELSWDNTQLNYALALTEASEDFPVTGFISADLIRAHVGDLSDKTFMICGPNAMYDFVLKQLEHLGVPQHKIKRELYGPPEHVETEAGWPENVKATDCFEIEVVGQKKITASAGEPLLNSLERNGLKVRSLCRSGECSYCRAKLVSGRVFMPAHTGLREADRNFGYIHTCVAYPLSNMKIKL